MEKRGLGKGLSALIPAGTGSRGEKVAFLKTSEVRSSRFQPRLEFNDEKQKELENSVKERGVIQPILVRPSGQGYELIAGERRLRAVRALGIPEVPAIVKCATDSESLQIALIENIQRDDLNPLEEAKAYQRLSEEFKMTHDRIAEAVGKQRASVSNTLRLLKLNKKIQDYISERRLTAGQARALLSIEGDKAQLDFCERIIREGLSARSVEEAVRKVHRRATSPSRKDPHIASLEQQLQGILATRVRIFAGRKIGRVEIEYYSLQDFERIHKLLLAIPH